MGAWRRFVRSRAAVLMMAAVAFTASGCGSSGPKTETAELTVSAAASLTESLNEIKERYEAQHPNVKITFNFGASGTLQQQIEQGAPADIFLSAGKKQMDALVLKQRIEEGTDQVLLGNELVLVTAVGYQGSVAGLADLSQAGIKKIGSGTPESVPAGSYAKEALASAKLWDTLQGKMVFTKDVKQVLTYVETGNTEAGFVFKTDALASPKVKIAHTVDPRIYSPIEYPIGIVKATKNRQEAGKLYRYLQSKEAMDVFLEYGFTTPK